MPSYRPIGDIWWLARAKLKDGRKYYGAYLGGFPERARALLGCRMDEAVLHVCGGMAKFYPYKRGYGPNDKTLDLDPKCEPDFLQDARAPFPISPDTTIHSVGVGRRWGAMLIDPPYSPEDASKYAVGAAVYPRPSELLRNAFDALESGHRVGIIHYVVPSPPKNSYFVAAVGIMCGFNNRIRAFSVFEKL